ncbi:MAG: hypothetical protein M0013_08435 [Actinomycetota bacterium]|nr:hypothetical protein [Actinomycetota bacterium]
MPEPEASAGLRRPSALVLTSVGARQVVAACGGVLAGGLAATVVLR